MGSTGTSSNWRIENAPAWDYLGDGEGRDNINTGYFDGVTMMRADTNLNDWIDEAASYSSWEQRILQSYVQDSSINSKLRDDPTYWDDEVGNLDTIIATHTLDKDTTLFSGLSNKSVANVDLSTIKTGDTFSIPTYLSTSPDPVYASGYALGSGNSEPTVLEIHAPKGTNIAKTFYDDVYGTEGVLGRHTTFRRIGDKIGSVNGRGVRGVVLEVV